MSKVYALSAVVARAKLSPARNGRPQPLGLLELGQTGYLRGCQWRLREFVRAIATCYEIRASERLPRIRFETLYRGFGNDRVGSGREFSRRRVKLPLGVDPSRCVKVRCGEARGTSRSGATATSSAIAAMSAFRKWQRRSSRPISGAKRTVLIWWQKWPLWPKGFAGKESRAGDKRRQWTAAILVPPRIHRPARLRRVSQPPGRETRRSGGQVRLLGLPSGWAKRGACLRRRPAPNALGLPCER